MNDTGFDVWCGLDVGKQTHHACALDAHRQRLFDKELPQDQTRLGELFERLKTHGRVLVIVDQPNTIGALPIAVARSLGIQVAYLPGLAMRRIADLHPGSAKTDARDAFIIADAARSMPHTLRRVDLGDENLAELKVLVGFDEDLTAETTACRTASAACSPRSPQPWSESSAPNWAPKQAGRSSNSWADPKASERHRGQSPRRPRTGRHDHRCLD